MKPYLLTAGAVLGVVCIVVGASNSSSPSSQRTSPEKIVITHVVPKPVVHTVIKVQPLAESCQRLVVLLDHSYHLASREDEDVAGLQQAVSDYQVSVAITDQHGIEKAQKEVHDNITDFESVIIAHQDLTRTIKQTLQQCKKGQS